MVARPDRLSTRLALASAMFLLTVLPAFALNELTTNDADANIGGGLVLLASIFVGVYLAQRSWSRSLTWRTVAIAFAVLAVVLAATYGLDAMDKAEHHA